MRDWPFYLFTPRDKKVAGYYVIPSKPFECPFVRQRFVSGLKLEKFLTDFLQTLHGH